MAPGVMLSEAKHLGALPHLFVAAEMLRPRAQIDTFRVALLDVSGMNQMSPRRRSS
jgi:hypothetical protein